MLNLHDKPCLRASATVRYPCVGLRQIALLDARLASVSTGLTIARWNDVGRESSGVYGWSFRLAFTCRENEMARRSSKPRKIETKGAHCHDIASPAGRAVVRDPVYNSAPAPSVDTRFQRSYRKVGDLYYTTLLWCL